MDHCFRTRPQTCEVCKRIRDHRISKAAKDNLESVTYTCTHCGEQKTFSGKIIIHEYDRYKY